MKRVKEIPRKTLFLIALLAFVLCGCAGDNIDLSGTWSSSEITNPSPFFAQTLPDTKPGSVSVSFDQSGRFVWLDREGRQLPGAYLVDGDALVLTLDQGETTRLKYTLNNDQLVLRTTDGFVFVLKKKATSSIQP